MVQIHNKFVCGMKVFGYKICFLFAILELEGGRFFFNIVKAGDEVIFAAEENADRVNWIYNLYNATGQSFKPAIPKLGVSASGADRIIQKFRGGESSLFCSSFIVTLRGTPTTLQIKKIFFLI